ncbi:MAG: ATP-binding cassette domain-containing protein, partial [Sweet potato little leaf phytoplasma]|nr:ATP-binding cassette domain-containing protein [Sweet potato little leaf phytoplasma]
MQALKQVDMLDFKERQISELSGGQQQRIFLARSLA